MSRWLKALISLCGAGIMAGSTILGSIATKDLATSKARTPEQNHAQYGQSCAKIEAYQKAIRAVATASLPDNGTPLTLNVTVDPQSEFMKACIDDKVQKNINRESAIEMLSAAFILVGFLTIAGGLGSLTTASRKSDSPRPEHV